jgi:hypothetical protein
MYKKYNPNPEAARVGDCTVRALCKALNQDWDKTYLQLCIQGLLMADMPSANAVWGAFLSQNGFKRGIVSESCPVCYTVADFAAEHPHGVYVIALGSKAMMNVSGCRVRMRQKLI